MHLEVLNDKEKKIFHKLNHFSDFYLAGGTALALQIGHRRSIDFDLFSDVKIPVGLLEKIETVFYGMAVIVSVNNQDELTVFVEDVKLTFLFYPFQLLYTTVLYEEVFFADIKEIAAMKAYTIGRRGSYKDYVDLYFLIRDGHITLDELASIALKKFGDVFNGRLFLEQLVYLDDIEDIEVLFLKESITKKEIEKFFTGEIKKISL